jgi:5-methyltetrahydrofolate--homocysteine methyltransferase
MERWLSDPETNPATGLTNFDSWSRYILTKKCDALVPADDAWDSLCAEGVVDPITSIGSFGELRVLFAEIRLDSNLDISFEVGLDIVDTWDTWFAGERVFLSAAGLPGSAAYQNSDAYTWWAKNAKLVEEVIINMVIALALSFLILNFATGNVVMSFFSTLTIGCIVVGVVAFTVLLGYKLGFMESICFVMVIGLSVDFVVHLSDAYITSKHQDRLGRIEYMLTALGVSVLNGALTSLG